MLKLQFRDRRQEAVWLVDQKFTIGTNPSNSLMINDTSVLDFHAEITNTSGKLSIINKSSTPSLWVNSQLVEKATPLKAEDVIRLGNIDLELIDPKTLLNKSEPNEKTTVEGSNHWAIHSKASWLEQNTFPIDGKIVIGRDASCDITLSLEHLSRKHLELEVRSGHLYIKDLDSSNGTFLNGQKITESEIKPGDKIKLDVVTFEVTGPAHDPNKTIIRAAIPATPAAAHKDKPTTKLERPGVKTKPKKTPKKRQHTPIKKSLVSKGKQNWISDTQPEEKLVKRNKTGLIVVVGSLIILGIIGIMML